MNILSNAATVFITIISAITSIVQPIDSGYTDMLQETEISASAPFIIINESDSTEMESIIDESVLEAEALLEAQQQETEVVSEMETASMTEIETETVTETESNTNDLVNNKVYQAYLGAKEENSDVCGWISILRLSLSYPILYSGDDYYLTHNADKQEDANGAIYLTSESNGLWGKVNLLNGHNMKSGLMFGVLGMYKDQEFAESHRDIEIALDGRMEYYRVFSVFTADANEENLKLTFNSESDFSSYKKLLKKRSLVELDFDDTTENILILNTCSYEFSNARTLVCAYKVSQETSYDIK